MTSKEEKPKKVGVMPIGIALTLIIGSILGYNLFNGDRSFFLVGQTSHGHYQIELVCESCHIGAFSSRDDMQQACESCHAEALDRVNDSHPKKKFLDPRNAELLDTLDARYCVTCHREHKPEITRKAGVTLASDFCFQCHSNIAEDRPSHTDFAFDSCASAGCHNFHDNSMLYEKFLGDHLDEPALKQITQLPARTGLKRWLKKNKRHLPLQVSEPDLTIFEADKNSRNKNTLDKDTQNPNTLDKIVAEWQASIHAKTGANCTNCHASDNGQSSVSFKVSPVEVTCKKCHEKQHQGFLESQHGMRIAQQMSSMSTDKARLPIVQLQQKLLDCNSCHDPHRLNIEDASAKACLTCHEDEHSKNYRLSKHYALWQKELSKALPVGSGVSCSSCHMPRIKKGKNVAVMHNQNFNLRPSSKMLRNVCMNCHGMEFSLASLADPRLIQNNFQGEPLTPHPTIKLIKERLKQDPKQ